MRNENEYCLKKEKSQKEKSQKEKSQKEKSQKDIFLLRL